METTATQSSQTHEANLTPERPPSDVRPVISEYIGVWAGYCGGYPHILGHRIKVKHVAVWHDQMGMTPTEIVARYPTITLAQVHAALAYYYDHRDEIQAEIEEEQRFVETLRAGQLSIFEKVRQRNAPDEKRLLNPSLRAHRSVP